LERIFGEDVDEDVGAVVEQDALVEVALVEELDDTPKVAASDTPCFLSQHVALPCPHYVPPLYCVISVSPEGLPPIYLTVLI